jgi:xanthine dehydrogenase YagR molybdenum-binding subunit
MSTTVVIPNDLPQRMSGRVVGHPFERTEARDKVRGAVAYTADIRVENVAYGAIVSSPIAKGTIATIDTSEAEAVPGVLRVFTPDTMPRLTCRPEQPDWEIMYGQSHVPMEDRQIVYAGQPIAYVVADTLEAAEHAAEVVRFTFDTDIPDLPQLESATSFEEPKELWLGYVAGFVPGQLIRGNGKAELDKADIRVGGAWTLSFNHHNPMELSATTAVWEAPDRLLVYETTQGATNFRNAYAKLFDLFRDRVRVVSAYIGGGFGCKGPIWPHSWLTVLAAREVGRPVRLAVTRAQMYTSVGYREEQRLELALSASREGRLHAMHLTKTSRTCAFQGWVEPSWYPLTFMYAVPHLETNCRLLTANVMSAVSMRAPGEAPGMFVQECALNELAVELSVDPIELRLRNHADVYPIDGSPWSSKRLKDCYARGAELVGWANRNPLPGTSRDGDWLIGSGMASASHTVYRQNAYARVAIREDGMAHASSSGSDLGTGTATFMRQILAEEFGLSMDEVTATIGESQLPDAAMQAGASLSASLGSATLDAARSLKAKIFAIATTDQASRLYRYAASDLRLEEGWIVAADSGQKERLSDILRRAGLTEISAEGSFEPGKLGEVYTGNGQRGVSEGRRGMHSFGAIFATVAVDPDLGLVRVRRLTGVYACGRILNPLLAKSQLIGGITWGMSQALFEATHMDQSHARFANANFAEYLVPVNADVPTIEVEFLEETDPFINPAGVKGVGEIGIVGVAAAIVDAIWHATGKRLRHLPITAEAFLTPE